MSERRETARANYAPAALERADAFFKPSHGRPSCYALSFHSRGHGKQPQFVGRQEQANQSRRRGEEERAADAGEEEERGGEQERRASRQSRAGRWAHAVKAA